jgi:hypothetical protein
MTAGRNDGWKNTNGKKELLRGKLMALAGKHKKPVRQVAVD